MIELLEKCKLCPRECGINRTQKTGFCGIGKNVVVAKSGLHFFEEPCLTGTTGSGTIFFAGCNLRCLYCQNYKISTFREENVDNSCELDNIIRDEDGFICKFSRISNEELASQMLLLQEKGANNINLVTAFSSVLQIIEAIKIARNMGLTIPIVYNSSGYESEKTIELLKGYIDIYLPDFKYYYDELALKYSNVKNYKDIVSKAIKKMIDQVGQNEFDDNGLMKKGVIIRHLILPNHIQNTKQVLKYIKNNYGKNVYISIMAQYFPEHDACKYEDLNRKITKEEYDEVSKFVDLCGFTNGFIQDFSDEDEHKYVPNF